MMVCSTQPGTPGTPPFWIEVNVLVCCHKIGKPCCQTWEIDFPSTFRHLDSFSLGICTPSAIFHSPSTEQVVQAISIMVWSNLRVLGHLLYSRYGTPLGPARSGFLPFYNSSDLLNRRGCYAEWTCRHKSQFSLEAAHCGERRCTSWRGMPLALLDQRLEFLTFGVRAKTSHIDKGLWKIPVLLVFSRVSFVWPFLFCEECWFFDSPLYLFP